MDYITKIITDLIIYRKIGFWQIKKILAERGVNLDKTVLLNRIKKAIEQRKKFKLGK